MLSSMACGRNEIYYTCSDGLWLNVLITRISLCHAYSVSSVCIAAIHCEGSEMMAHSKTHSTTSSLNETQLKAMKERFLCASEILFS